MHSESANHGQGTPDWDAFRRQMPVAERLAYLDHAAVAPISGPACEAVVAWAEQAAVHGATVWSDWNRRVQAVRRVAAGMMGAGEDQLALVKNTTAGICLVAEGYPWQPGDNVVTLANEFPSNLYPWMNLASRGVETRRVPVDQGRVDLSQLAAACDERTRIVAVSWVGFASGWRHDVDELATLAHEHGALLFLDAIQGLGIFPLDVSRTPVDFLAADGHKWMLGPEGAGLFYVRRDHLDLLHPWGVGWHSVVREHDFDHIQLDLKPTAARFEGGSENIVGNLALGASLELLMSFGVPQIAHRILQLTDLACQRLTDAGATIASARDGQRRSGIVSFTWPGDMGLLRQQLLRQGVVVSYRDGRLRISPHAYNNEEDLDRLIQALQTTHDP
ncbi:MAG: aminotransferase class V-fold PLP-dependent enzyme [Planctomycetales bacterium]|nr:aminotransferase class V-fold PLP-dependent enzyme [Planctomycetales bacterium]NIM09424.1 aminotransferase class V-fold PLP-dependent enzyme [Planctomycetales bacterium]NIN08902.1 aminotransferase class V-fold PLP-dependent enzyme [Planctomycetales bacterium]NIN78017.1 aminotransferase class V-fold PLP-dependent enzyme [Planctomycetales bacterium]NIO35205.1 aminotransferase class V-fold PLP-dependent enzyme [Planctomycetales bacterium]